MTRIRATCRLQLRLARIEAQRDNRTYQTAWDADCREHGWLRIDVGDAQCIEDLLLELQRETGPQPTDNPVYA